jgi:hypothetical protein
VEAYDDEKEKEIKEGELEEAAQTVQDQLRVL